MLLGLALNEFPQHRFIFIFEFSAALVSMMCEARETNSLLIRGDGMCEKFLLVANLRNQSAASSPAALCREEASNYFMRTTIPQRLLMEQNGKESLRIIPVAQRFLHLHFLTLLRGFTQPSI
jgi:hypothetical protein